MGTAGVARRQARLWAPAFSRRMLAFAGWCSGGRARRDGGGSRGVRGVVASKEAAGNLHAAEGEPLKASALLLRWPIPRPRAWMKSSCP
jgi:hypothetical protein